MAVVINWGFLLCVSLRKEPYFLRSIYGPETPASTEPQRKPQDEPDHEPVDAPSEGFLKYHDSPRPLDSDSSKVLQ